MTPSYEFISLLSPTEPSAKPGEISFSRSSFSFSEGVGYAKIELQRLYGSDGKVEVKWKTEDHAVSS